MGTDVKVFDHTMAADVAQGGTFTVTYPTGTNRGNFLKGKNHKFIAMGTLFEAPEDFTISFGTTTATITYNGATTLADTSVIKVQLDMQGEETLDVYAGLANGAVQKQHPLLVNLGSPILFDIDSIIDGATSTELPDATPTTVTYTQANIGTSPCDGVNTTWVLATPRNLTMTVTHGSSIVACEARITGLDVYGAVLNETLAVTATGTSKTATGVKAFKEITEIVIYSASDMQANTVEIGHGSALGLPVHVSDQHLVQAELVDGAVVVPQTEIVRVPFQLTEAEVDAGGSFYVFPGFAGSVVGGGLVIENTVTTGGTISLEINNTAVAGFGLVVADSATAGTVATDTVLTNDGTEVFTAAQPLEIIVPSAFNASAPINGYFDCKRTIAHLSGTVVPGLSPATKSTATTADVRGLYTSATTLDGSAAIALVVSVSDPSFLGNPQYEG